MSDIVLDASAVMAFLQEESGCERIEPHLRSARISSVNLAEVVTKLQDRGLSDAEIDETLDLLGLTVRAFDEQTAIIAGKLRAATRNAGLSLGDRACLALAVHEGSPAWTADKEWLTVAAAIGVTVVTIR